MVRPSDDDEISNSRIGEVDDENAGIHRREYLQFAGLASVPFVAAGAASKTACADAGGYGVSGYGDSGYGANGGSGGSTGSAPAVSTLAPTAVDETSATLNGSVDDLGGASAVTASFEYREVGSDQWTAAAATTLSSAGTYSAPIGPLTAGTDYEFRAVATTDTDRSVGSTASFSTLAPPVIKTRAATAITDDGATLVAELDALGDSAAVETAFEYRKLGAADWQRTPAVERSSPGEVTRIVADLDAGTDYEYRALATGGSTTARAETVSQFTTTADASGGDSDASVEMPNTLIFDGSEINLSSYAFSVSGEVTRVDALTTANDSDWYFLSADDRAVGMLGDGQHGYRYSGRITSLEISGNATVRIDRQ